MCKPTLSMKKRLLALSAFIAFATGISYGQQDKLLTHFIYDKMTINPGSTGLDEGICGSMIYRNQWDKVNGAPNSTIFNVEANMNRFFPGGIGISFYNDAIGFARQNNAILNYSYPIDIAGKGTLGIGVGVGIVNFGMNPIWSPPTAQFDNTLPGKSSGTNVDLNAGLYWKSSNNKYFAGLSSTHLSQSDIKALNYSTYRHYNILGGYRFMDVVGVDRDIDVQVLMRTDLIKFSADINVRYMHENLFYGGLTFRTSDAIAVMLGFTPMPNFTVGYSYDLTINKLASISRGTHELAVKYCYFIPPRPITKSKHPRWL